MKCTPTSSRPFLLLAALVVALAIPTAAVAHIPEPVSWQPLPIGSRVLQPGEFLDLTPLGPPQVFAAAASKRDGFLAAVGERLGSKTSPVKAINIAVQFASSRAARRQVVAWCPRGMHTGLGAVSIPGELVSAGPTDLRIAFADGDFAYVISATWPTKMTSHPTRTQLIGAAGQLYRRVHGHPAG